MGRADVTPGSTVGTYDVQGTLGATAWSETFVASTGEKLFALKVFDKEDDAAWDAVELTKKQLQSVPDHLVLPIVDAGVDEESGVRFIATRLSDHPSLADLVDVYALAPAEAIVLVKNLGIAIDAAHSAELTHLALKPSNVFVGPPPTYAVRLVDFAADALRRAKKERGALAWLAPEQIDSDQAADARADVFTAALLAFFAMTGKSYWAALDDEETLLAEIEAPRVTPSLRARAVGASIPTKLDAVMMKALGPLETRFDSARTFAEAFEGALAEPTPSVEEQRSSERHIKATLKLEKFRMPTLENSAPSGMQPLPQRTQRLPPAQIPDVVERPIEAAPAATTAAPIATPIEGVAPRPRRTVYISQRILVVLGIAVTALTLGVVVAALRKIRSEPLPAPSASVASAQVGPPGPPTSIVVPPPPTAEPPPPVDVDALGSNESELQVVCTPACDKVLVDGKYMSQYPAPLRLTPGKHGVGVGRTGYGGQFRTVVLKPGERLSIAFTLGPLPNRK